MDPLSPSRCEPVTVTGGLRRPVKTESFVKRTDSLSRFFGKSQQKSPPNGSKWHFPAVKAGMRPDRKNPPVFPSCTIPNTAKTCFLQGLHRFCQLSALGNAQQNCRIFRLHLNFSKHRPLCAQPNPQSFPELTQRPPHAIFPPQTSPDIPDDATRN